MLIPEERFQSGLRNFANHLHRDFSLSIPANPEDQLKRPICTLIETFYPDAVQTRTETPVEGLGARPDIGVILQSLLCGHIELKAPGKGANTSRFTGTDRVQWKKFRALPNLMYTDGSEWALYRNGERVGHLLRFSGDIFTEGQEAVSENDALRLYELLTNFLTWQPIVPDRPRALAEMLALWPTVFSA